MVMFRTASSMIFPLLATHSITFRSTHLGAAANSPSSESWSLTPRKRCHQEMLALSSSNSYWASQSEFAGNSDVECFLAKQLKNNLIKGCILRTTVLKVLKDLEIDEYLNPEDSMSMNGIVGIAAPRHNESYKVINSTMPGILGYIHKCWIILIWDSGILWYDIYIYCIHHTSPRQNHCRDILRISRGRIRSDFDPLPTLRCNTPVLWIQAWNQTEQTERRVRSALLGGSATRFGFLGLCLRHEAELLGRACLVWLQPWTIIFTIDASVKFMHCNDVFQEIMYSSMGLFPSHDLKSTKMSDKKIHNYYFFE